MYDPNAGRWFTEDPIGFDADDPDLYRYVGNSPTNAVDPTGLERMTKTGRNEPDNNHRMTQAEVRNAVARLEAEKEREKNRTQEVMDKTWTQQDILKDFDKWAKSDWRRAGWPREKIAKYRADLVALFDAVNSAEVANSQTGVNQCVKWVSAVLDNWKRKTTLVQIEIESWEYPAGIPFTDHFLGHSAFKVVLPNGRAFYLDNGWWGNSEHIFGTLDSSPLARPIGFFEKPWWPFKVFGELAE